MNRQAGNLSAACLQGTGYRASLGAIAVEGERFQGCCCQIDWVPFEDERSLSSIAQAKNRRRRGLDTIGIQDALLEGLEGRCIGGLSDVIARNGDVDDAAG